MAELFLQITATLRRIHRGRHRPIAVGRATLGRYRSAVRMAVARIAGGDGNARRDRRTQSRREAFVEHGVPPARPA
ncbi:MAG: hypothetical protein AB7N65_27850, partial [Vicinamibacterales bacterium]